MIELTREESYVMARNIRNWREVPLTDRLRGNFGGTQIDLAGINLTGEDNPEYCFIFISGARWDYFFKTKEKEILETYARAMVEARKRNLEEDSIILERALQRERAMFHGFLKIKS